MTEAVLNIKRWGNNLGVRLPAAVAREAHLHADQRVRMSVQGGNVVITPVTDVLATLEQRLALFVELHITQNLNAGDQGINNIFRQLNTSVQNSVHTISHAHFFTQRLNVNV